MLDVAGPQTTVRESAALRVHFWLAHGFIPYGPVEVLSVLDPPGMAAEMPLRRSPSTRSGYALRESGVSSQILNGSKALHTPARVLQWVAHVPQSASFPSPPGWARDGFHVDDLSRVAEALLAVDWHDWGYLVWKSGCRFWTAVLESGASPLRVRSNRRLVYAFLRPLLQQSRREDALSVLDWDATDAGYHPVKVKEYVRFERAVAGLIRRDLQWAAEGLGTLFITRRAFQDSVYALLDPLGPDRLVASTSDLDTPPAESRPGAGPSVDGQIAAAVAEQRAPGEEPRRAVVSDPYGERSAPRSPDAPAELNRSADTDSPTQPPEPSAEPDAHDEPGPLVASDAQDQSPRTAHSPPDKKNKTAPEGNRPPTRPRSPSFQSTEDSDFSQGSRRNRGVHWGARSQSSIEGPGEDTSSLDRELAHRRRRSELGLRLGTTGQRGTCGSFRLSKPGRTLTVTWRPGSPRSPRSPPRRLRSCSRRWRRRKR
ncbi:hypothetical protein VTK73DRAFT_7784 [Phialemonium thermophilum]|uniref:Uncharacterized protein n=1 Tax=Phialemonium thermophilum TaxID=223376 RepID=A0ABR3WD27_9PEZI